MRPACLRSLGCLHKSALSPLALHTHLLSPSRRSINAEISAQRVCIECNSRVPHYADLKIDRAAWIRKDAARLRTLSDSSDAQLVCLHAYAGLLSPSKEDPTSSSLAPKWRLATLPGPSVTDDSIDERLGRIFLGLDSEHRPYFAVAVTDQAADSVAALHDEAEWVELRREGGPNLPPGDAALVAYAAGMVYWGRRNLYSGSSGRRLSPVQAGHARAAEKERAIFTRIDPAVIMAVTCGDWILLGRQSSWSPGRYSLLAGFCEIGETLEQAVVRETLEEARVAVDLGSVRYYSSQPWPFPQSLMIGFTATVAASNGGEQRLQGEGAVAAEQKGITKAEIDEVLGNLPGPANPDEQELEAAFWFHRSFVADSLKGLLPAGVEFAIPGPHALANRIITEWAQCSTGGTAWAGQAVPDVEIDIGRFKYVLLRISSSSGQSKLVVRGDRSKAFHADIFHAVRGQLESSGLQVSVLGGGRIENGVRDISVFGYSSAFGAAPHELTAALLRREYPMADIRTSYAGY